jgi:hypothetical protein
MPVILAFVGTLLRAASEGSTFNRNWDPSTPFLALINAN